MEDVERGALPDGALPSRITPNKNRALQAGDPASTRKLFDAERKAVFLEWFAATASLSWSARQAGVHYRTVLRHRMEDPEFGAAYDLAEAQAAPRLRAWLAEVRGEAARRMAAAAEEDDSDGVEDETAPARMSVEQAMQFLRDYEAMEARRSRALARAPGAPGRGRPVSVASNEEVREALVKALGAFGIRVRALRYEASTGSASTQDEREGE
ncbi:MAG: hypothetical protein ACJ8ER_12795 [Allosphingosinicella sp.]